MGRLLLLIALAGLVWWVVRALLQGGRRDNETTSRTEDMVACAHCGLHVPRSECVVSMDRCYCCEAHARASDGKP